MPVFLQLLVSMFFFFVVLCLLLKSSTVTGWSVLHAWLQVREQQRLPFICLCVCDDCMPENSGTRLDVSLQSFPQPFFFLQQPQWIPPESASSSAGSLFRLSRRERWHKTQCFTFQAVHGLARVKPLSHIWFPFYGFTENSAATVFLNLRDAGTAVTIAIHKKSCFLTMTL